MVEKLKIDSSVTLQQVEQFIQKNKTSDQDKIRGRAITGGYEIYVDNKKSSFLDRVTGKAAERNKAAADGLNFVKKNFYDKCEASGLKLNRNDFFADVTKRMSMDGKHSVRAGNAQTAFGELKQVGLKLGMPTNYTNITAPQTAPVLASPLQMGARGTPLPFDNVQTLRIAGLAQKVAGPNATASDRQALVTAITNAIDTSAKKLNLSPDAMKALAMSSGETVKSLLSDAVAKHLATHGSTPPPDFEKALDEGFRKFADGVLNTKQSGTQQVTLTTGEKVTLPVIEIGGKRYEPTSTKLGEGGFGDVFLYKNPTDDKDVVAFKMIKNMDPSDKAGFEEALGETISEIQIQQKANLSGSPHIAKIEGAVRLDGGGIGIAMESAPHGSMFELAGNLSKVVGKGPGQLSQKEANVVRLTQIKQMLEGVKAFQSQGIIHFDLKSPNCLIGADGKLKIIDFGKARVTGSVKLEDLPAGLDNPRYVAPEVHKGKSEREAYKQSKLDDVATQLRTVTDSVVPLPVNPSQNDVDNAELVRQSLAERIAGALGPKFSEESIAQVSATATGKVDNWGVGVALVELLSGKQILDWEQFNVAEAIVAWQSDPTSTVVGGPNATNCLIRLTGDPNTDGPLTDPGMLALLNGLLHKDPAQRLSVDDALALPIFKTPGVGSKGVEDVMPTLTELTSRIDKRDAFVRGDLTIAARNVGIAIADELMKSLPDHIQTRINGTQSLTSEQVNSIIGDLKPGEEKHEAVLRDVLSLRGGYFNRTLSHLNVDRQLQLVSDTVKTAVKTRLDTYNQQRQVLTGLDANVGVAEQDLAKVKSKLTAVV